MTYRELKVKLSELTDEQLDCDVTVLDERKDECWAVFWDISTEYDVLDANHPIIVLRENL